MTMNTENSPTKIQLTDSSDSQIFSIEKLKKLPKGVSKLDISNNNKSLLALPNISSLLACVPSTIASNELSNGQYFQVVANGDLVKSKNSLDGFRAIVMGDKGIAQNAELFEPDKLSNLVNFSVAFVTISTLVGQKHLADINQKLNEISNTLSRIENFQQNERTAKIYYWAKKIKDYSTIFAHEHELHPIVAQELSSCDNDLGPIQLHLQKDLQIFADEFSEGKISNSKKDQFTNFLSLFTACVKTRALAAFLLTTVHSYDVWSKSVLNSLIQDIQAVQIIVNEVNTIFSKIESVNRSSFFADFKNIWSSSTKTEINISNAIKNSNWKKKLQEDIKNTQLQLEFTQRSKLGAYTFEIDDKGEIKQIYC